MGSLFALYKSGLVLLVLTKKVQQKTFVLLMQTKFNENINQLYFIQSFRSKTHLSSHVCPFSPSSHVRGVHWFRRRTSHLRLFSFSCFSQGLLVYIYFCILEGILLNTSIDQSARITIFCYFLHITHIFIVTPQATRKLFDVLYRCPQFFRMLVQ